ncbi:MAG TPA: sulfurtransferase-like selenium metabolism protein YedF [bacterium]|nr:sulfurtransferase-like selenium metabolism protein YedF [bacterium]HQG47319.1 sulfurtransferase-like selenium metabolism protein YedF [bacterium]HQI47530.1 sulfurtransferase-like selenium metabolism protein YedF [bacterium]HQJ63107.1 sulfurtransferase-like selenium metabolism protein YedF [bacterium]
MTLLYLNSDQMGSGGDPALGKKLLKLFLEKLAASDVQVDLVGCVNSGVYLTSEGSEVLESLKKLAEKGARIATCGTCLDHLHLAEKLQIGEIGNMDMTIQVMAAADKIIRP